MWLELIMPLLIYNYIHIVSVMPVQVGLERDGYSVGEAIGDDDLALLVCAITTTNVQFGFTATISLQNGTAIGKNISSYITFHNT